MSSTLIIELYSQMCKTTSAIDVSASQDVIVNSSFKPELAGTLQDFHVTSIECKPAPSFNKTL